MAETFGDADRGSAVVPANAGTTTGESTRAMAEEADALLKTQRQLSNWWSTMSARATYRATKPRCLYNWYYCGRSQRLNMAGALAIPGR